MEIAVGLYIVGITLIMGYLINKYPRETIERDIATLSAEEREKIVNELNRVAVGYLGYQKEKTA